MNFRFQMDSQRNQHQPNDFKVPTAPTFLSTKHQKKKKKSKQLTEIRNEAISFWFPWTSIILLTTKYFTQKIIKKKEKKKKPVSFQKIRRMSMYIIRQEKGIIIHPPTRKRLVLQPKTPWFTNSKDPDSQICKIKIIKYHMVLWEPNTQNTHMTRMDLDENMPKLHLWIRSPIIKTQMTETSGGEKLS